MFVQKTTDGVLSLCSRVTVERSMTWRRECTVILWATLTLQSIEYQIIGKITIDQLCDTVWRATFRISRHNASAARTSQKNKRVFQCCTGTVVAALGETKSNWKMKWQLKCTEHSENTEPSRRRDSDTRTFPLNLPHLVIALITGEPASVLPSNTPTVRFILGSYQNSTLTCPSCVSISHKNQSQNPW